MNCDTRESPRQINEGIVTPADFNRCEFWNIVNEQHLIVNVGNDVPTEIVIPKLRKGLRIF